MDESGREVAEEALLEYLDMFYKLGAAGRDRARERYTVEHSARAYQKLWAEVVAAPRTHG